MEAILIQIHKELEKHIWPLKPDEYRILEQNILAEGIRDKIITWQGYIVDGHNRYRIAQEHSLTFDTIEKDFDNIEDVKDWMDANQLGRRNLTKDQYEISIGRRYEREKTIGHGAKTAYQNDTQNIQTADRIGDEYKISAPTVKRYAKKAKEFEKLQEEKPEVAKAIWSGEKSFKDVQKEIKKEDNQIKIQKIKTRESEPPTGKYDVIVIDPPWEMQKIERDVAPNQVGFDYPTMTIDEIKKIHLPMNTDCHIFLWITQKHHQSGWEILRAWGGRFIC